MDNPEDKKDPWKEFLENSKKLSDFAEEEESVGDFSESITLDRKMIQLLHSIKQLSSDDIANMIPEVLITNDSMMSDMMHWVHIIASEIIMKLVYMGIIIQPSVVNNVYIYAALIYVRAKGGSGALGETEEDID